MKVLRNLFSRDVGMLERYLALTTLDSPDFAPLGARPSPSSQPIVPADRPSRSSQPIVPDHRQSSMGELKVGFVVDARLTNKLPTADDGIVATPTNSC